MKWSEIVRIFLTPLAVIALSACATTSKAERTGSNVHLGETVMVNGQRIKPINLLEDSRCPANVQCIWAGRVRLKMLWVKASGNQEFELISGEPRPLTDGTITLTSIRPNKASDQPIQPEDYRFSFEFKSGL